MSTTSVAEKLQIKTDAVLWSPDPDRLRLLEPLPAGARSAERAEDATAAVVFCDDATAVRAIVGRHAAALREAQPVWVAYRKGNRSDVNRDTLWPILTEHGMRPTGQVAIDDEWSALRFRALRPGETFKAGAKT